jgi:hypothetical protein
METEPFGHGAVRKYFHTEPILTIFVASRNGFQPKLSTLAFIILMNLRYKIGNGLISGFGFYVSNGR